jgi:hypothetical protein
MFKIFRHMFGEQNVTGIPAVHDPLGDVDSGPCDISPIINVPHLTHGTTVNPHPNRDRRLLAQSAADFQCAPDRGFRTVSKDQGHPISGRDPYQPIFCLGRAKPFGSLDKLIQLTKQSSLIVDEQLGIANHVDK